MVKFVFYPRNTNHLLLLCFSWPADSFIRYLYQSDISKINKISNCYKELFDKFYFFLYTGMSVCISQLQNVNCKCTHI